MSDGSRPSSQGERVGALFDVRMGGCLGLAIKAVFLEHNLHFASWQCFIMPSLLVVLAPEQCGLHLASSFGSGLLCRVVSCSVCSLVSSGHGGVWYSVVLWVGGFV
jgi:hypothetical protein